MRLLRYSLVVLSSGILAFSAAERADNRADGRCAIPLLEAYIPPDVEFTMRTPEPPKEPVFHMKRVEPMPACEDETSSRKRWAGLPWLEPEEERDADERPPNEIRP